MRRSLPLLSLIGLLAATRIASGAVYSASWNSGFANAGVVPDGNLLGWTDVRSLTIPAGQTIVDINVELSFTGAWNGDLYAFLSHPNGSQAAILLNRPGRTALNSFGYNDDHLTITLDDSAALGDVHFYQSATGYATAISDNSAWQPDGRPVSPLSATDTDARTAPLGVLNGIDATTGSWTLFVADVSTGSQPTVTRWGLSITTIPEPGTAGLLVLLGLTAMVTTRRRPGQSAG